jgi:replicative superfamily II helicase
MHFAEKWDVVTRKSGTEANSLGNQCGLLIIDEVCSDGTE